MTEGCVEDSCQLIYNLTFCTNVNYAVPGNRSLSSTHLGQMYDNNTQKLYTNFFYSMQQVPCNASSDARYSLAVTCDNCIAAYKEWLCAVTMPRCMDYSSLQSYLQLRNVAQSFPNGTYGSSITSDPSFSMANMSVTAFNQSRNPWIDSTIRPGPYKELLPCDSLCYGLVQSCPSALGFSCPYAGQGFNASYSVASMDGNFPRCNLPGAIWGVGAAHLSQPSTVMLTFPIIAIIWVFCV